MAKECTNMKMETNMKETGKTGIKVERARTHIRTANNIKETGKMVIKVETTLTKYLNFLGLFVVSL
jgi:hypothetical protein